MPELDNLAEQERGLRLPFFLGMSDASRVMAPLAMPTDIHGDPIQCPLMAERTHRTVSPKAASHPNNAESRHLIW